MLTKNIRQIIRKEGFKNLKRRYYLNILVTFIFSVIISGGYQFATRTGDNLNDTAISTTASIVEAGSGNGLMGKDSNQSNFEIVRQFIFNIFEIQEISDPDDIPTTSEKYYGGVASVFVNEIKSSIPCPKCFKCAKCLKAPDISNLKANIENIKALIAKVQRIKAVSEKLESKLSEILAKLS